jgi:SulP family sulfate permease
MILAVLLFIRNVAQTTTVTRVTPDYVREGYVHALQDKDIPDDVTIFRIHGPFLFGATDQLYGVLDRIDSLAPTIIFRLRNMTAIDATGLGALEDVTERLHASGRTVILCGARDQPRAVMETAGFVESIGRDNVCANIDAALERANQLRQRRAVAV